MTAINPRASQTSTLKAASSTPVIKATSESKAKQLDWPAIISKWQASGLTKRAFCTEQSINYDHFIYHNSKKSRQQITSPKLLPIKIANDTSSINAHPIGVFRENHFMLHYPNGTRLSIPAQADEGTLKLILSCIGEK
jgi:hypothetical protein